MLNKWDNSFLVWLDRFYIGKCGGEGGGKIKILKGYSIFFDYFFVYLEIRK